MHAPHARNGAVRDFASFLPLTRDLHHHRVTVLGGIPSMAPWCTILIG
jgi:hypothetical protein